MSLPAPLRARELKAQANLVDIVSRYTSLRKTGKQYVGRCPLHSERDPSFYVHPEKKVFYRFSCGTGGDVFEFVMRADGCNF
jgi:DNA primase